MPVTKKGASKRPATDDDDDVVVILPPPLYCHTRGPVVRVHVGSGDQRETHTLHKDLIQEKSEYFRAAFGGSFAESVTNELSLPDDNPAGFDCFVEWLYSGKITEGHDRCGLICAWILADKLMCRDFQNQTIDALLSNWTIWTVTGDEFILLLQSNLGDSKLMDLMLTVAGHDLSRYWEHYKANLKIWLGTMDRVMTIRLMEKMHEYDRDTDAPDPVSAKSCRWHEHGSGSEGSCDGVPNKKRKTG